MSKITSPVAAFPGTVTLPERLTFPQVFAWIDAVGAAQSHLEQMDTSDPTGREYLRALHEYLPGLVACVEQWELAGVPAAPTPDTFPASPPKHVSPLILWLVGEVSKVYKGEVEIPNA